MTEILILGTDKRLQYVADILSEKYSTEIYLRNYKRLFSDKKRKYDVLVLGIPCCTDGENVNIPLSDEKIPLDILPDIVAENGVITGGMIPPRLYEICREKGIACEDYYKSEAVVLKNAVPSAEGALALGINMTADTIFKAKILITGYGRIASILAKYLVAMGADVTVAARKEEKLILAEINGCKATDFCNLHNVIGEFSLIYNTVPDLVIDKKTAEKINDRAVYIELASKPGIDTTLCREYGINFVNGGGLPSKTAPKTAGKIIADSIKQILDIHGKNHNGYGE